MRKIIVVLVLLALSLPALGQRLIVGEKAPELRVARWLDGSGASAKKTMLIEFFLSSSEPSLKRIPELDALAKKYPSVDVVVITREAREKVASLFPAGKYAFRVALDDEGKTFSGYGVQFIPFAVLQDARGRVVWFGNSSQLTEEEVARAAR